MTVNSQIWRYLTRNRKEVENHISWKIQSGNCSFWWDNLLGDGALATYCDRVSSVNNMKIGDFLDDGKWNERAIRQNVPPLLIPSILNHSFQYKEGRLDAAIWMHEDNGQFTIASAWRIIRRKKLTDPINKCIWHKSIPFKVSFFIGEL